MYPVSRLVFTAMPFLMSFAFATTSLAEGLGLDMESIVLSQVTRSPKVKAKLCRETSEFIRTARDPKLKAPEKRKRLQAKVDEARGAMDRIEDAYRPMVESSVSPALDEIQTHVKGNRFNEAANSVRSRANKAGC